MWNQLFEQHKQFLLTHSVVQPRVIRLSEQTLSDVASQEPEALGWDSAVPSQFVSGGTSAVTSLLKCQVVIDESVPYGHARFE